MNLFKMLFWKKEMQDQADWFDNNEPAQARFEENEEWLEEMEERMEEKFSDLEDELSGMRVKIRSLMVRITDLEKDAHPCKDLQEFDGYPELLEKIQKMIDDSK